MPYHASVESKSIVVMFFWNRNYCVLDRINYLGLKKFEHPWFHKRQGILLILTHICQHFNFPKQANQTREFFFEIMSYSPSSMNNSNPFKNDVYTRHNRQYPDGEIAFLKNQWPSSIWFDYSEAVLYSTYTDKNILDESY